MSRRAPFLAAVAAIGLVVAPGAAAKFGMTLVLGKGSPQAGQPLTVSLRADVELPADHELALLAVAPGRLRYGAVATLTAGASARDGFVVPLTRTRADRWRAIVRFPRSGRWQLVVPNWGPEGYAIPPPLVRAVVVR
jgi:hypothetical protein